MVGASNNIGLLSDHSGGGEVILSFTSPALQKYNCMLDSSVVGRRSPPPLQLPCQILPSTVSLTPSSSEHIKGG